MCVILGCVYWKEKRPSEAEWKAFCTWSDLLLLCFRRADMLEELTLSDYKGSRPLQRASSTKIQQHKQLIKVRWRRQKSCPPCWDIECLPEHCYPTTKGAGWDTQTKKWEQTEIRDGYEEDSDAVCVPPHSSAPAAFASWQAFFVVSASARPEPPRIKEKERFKESQLIQNWKVSLHKKSLSRQFSGLMKVHISAA